MSYIWNEFNIKTFPAETIVYRDGLYCPELSTIKNDIITTRYDLPVHIIYVGKINGDCSLDTNIGVDEQKVFISVDVVPKSSFAGLTSYVLRIVVVCLAAIDSLSTTCIENV